MPVDWLRLVELIAPAILAVIPGIPPILIPVIIQAIQAVETLPMTGPQKKTEVLAVVKTAAGHGSGLMDPVAVSTGIDASVNAVNAILTAHT